MRHVCLSEYEGVVVEEAACDGEEWTRGYEFERRKGGCVAREEGDGGDFGGVEEEGGEDGEE